MSIQSEINRLKTAKTNLASAIESKGVDVSDNAKISDYPALVSAITMGTENIQKQAYTGGATWYYPLGKMVIDNSGNYGNFTFTGRFGGWVNSNTATYTIMLMNRANYDGNTITSTVSASGAITQALNCCDIVVSKNSDKSHTVYLKCKDYFVFDFAYTAFQHEIIYDGIYTETEPSDIIWQLSTAPKTILYPNGSFEATGGINATSLSGYGLRVVTDVNDTGKVGYITIIK